MAYDQIFTLEDNLEVQKIINLLFIFIYNIKYFFNIYV